MRSRVTELWTACFILGIAFACGSSAGHASNAVVHLPQSQCAGSGTSAKADSKKDETKDKKKEAKMKDKKKKAEKKDEAKKDEKKPS